MTANMTFLKTDRLPFLRESDPPEIKASWLPASWMPAINRVFRSLFYFDRTDYTSRIEEIRVDHASVIDTIGHSQELMEMIYNQRCKSVLMGPKQLRSLNTETASYMTFKMDVLLGGHRGIQVRGVDVHIIPWMDGIVGLPNEIKIIPER